MPTITKKELEEYCQLRRIEILHRTVCGLHVKVLHRIPEAISKHFLKGMTRFQADNRVS